MARSVDEQVDKLVEYYARFTGPHPLVTDLCGDNQRMTAVIDAALHHERAMLDKRSTDPYDDELTVFDRAFLELALFECKNPAITLWIEEILGVNAVAPEKQAEIVEVAALTKAALITCASESVALLLPNTELVGAYDQGGKVFPSDSPDTEKLVCPSSNGPMASQDSVHDRSEGRADERTQNQSPSSDPIARLISTCISARRDFEDAPKKSIRKTQTARFLRDTIENCLNFLGTQRDMEATIEQKAVAVEMSEILPQVTAVAEKGCGGKKRPFEGARRSSSESEQGARVTKRVAVGSNDARKGSGDKGIAIRGHANGGSNAQVKIPMMKTPQYHHNDRHPTRRFSLEDRERDRRITRPVSREYDARSELDRDSQVKNRTFTPTSSGQYSGYGERTPPRYATPSPWSYDAHVPKSGNANYTPIGEKRGGWNGRSPFQGERRRGHERGAGRGLPGSSARSTESGSKAAERQGFRGYEDGEIRMGGDLRGGDTYRPRY